ncbi:MAG: serine protein kinase [Desulfobacteraceae bacterium IS3]|nr:MAG: serine protein kinase [Desulfobacteraceae bacterium IS3]
MNIMEETIKNAMDRLDRNMSEQDQHSPIPFEDFLKELVSNPSTVIRNVFQVFHDMMKHYVSEGFDEYPNDPESINFVYYDCNRLFVEGADHPFFADRLFANRLIAQVEALRRGAQQNKIYIFDGPPGCGKSTFLNNLLMKFEEYTNTDAGLRYEAVWRLNRKVLGSFTESEGIPIFEKMLHRMEHSENDPNDFAEKHNMLHSSQSAEGFCIEEDNSPHFTEDYIEVPCPSHDHPILMIAKPYRLTFFDDLFSNDEFKWKHFTEKEYDWVFRDSPCTICSSIYNALLNRLKNPRRVFDMLYARPYRFNRRLGEGISVFNPGDKPMRQEILSNAMLQRRINSLLRDSNQVKYLFSRYAKTNNGIYALMDIKSHNVERVIELHNIISEGVHKVEDIEENVNTLLMALMNPEDKKNVENFQSFSDRIEYVHIPYILDLNTEVNIYRNIFGRHIDNHFLPRVLHNFARVVISSRLNIRSEAMLEWISDPKKYRLYCDDNLQLLKMEIYTGYIPPWLSDDDRKNFTAQRRRKIIAESEAEGQKGFSGRDAIKIFNDFFSTYARDDRLINMSTLCNFFTKVKTELSDSIPRGLLDSLLQMYNYTILNEVKESLYYYNEEQISRDIRNYMFAVNFETGAVETCKFTGEKLEITEDYLMGIEIRLLGTKADRTKRLAFRRETQKEYTSRTLTQEHIVEGKAITETELYHNLHERYVHNLKEKVLDPFLENENFRQAIKDYNEENFKTYDKRIRDDVTFLMNNLISKCRYTEQGAKEVCIYVIDSNLAKKFTTS